MSSTMAGEDFFDGRRKRLPLLLIIALLHVVFFFCWSSRIHRAQPEQPSLLLPIWNVLEQNNLHEEKKPDTKLDSRPPAETAPHKAKQTVEKQAQPAAPAAPIRPAETPATAEAPAAVPAQPQTATAPRLDYDGITRQALTMDKHREITPAEKLRQEQFAPHTVESGIADAAKRGTRGDCQTTYSGMGLLAVVPLLIDTVTDHGCKWK